MTVSNRAFRLAYPFFEHADLAMPRNPAKDSRPSFGRAHVRVWERDYKFSCVAVQCKWTCVSQYSGIKYSTIRYAINNVGAIEYMYGKKAKF